MDSYEYQMVFKMRKTKIYSRWLYGVFMMTKAHKKELGLTKLKNQKGRNQLNIPHEVSAMT